MFEYPNMTSTMALVWISHKPYMRTSPLVSNPHPPGVPPPLIFFGPSGLGDCRLRRYKVCLFIEVDELVTHFIVTYSDKYSVSEAKSKAYGEGLITAVALFKFKGVNIVRCAKQSRNSVYISTVPVTVVPRTFIQEPMCLALGIRRRSGASWFSAIPLVLASLVPSRIFFITTFFPEHQKVIGGGELSFPCHLPNQLHACTS